MPVEVSKSGTTVYTGSAIRGRRAIILIAAIDVYLRTGLLMNEELTPERMAVVAKEYTGKDYVPGEGLREASADLKVLKVGKTLDQLGECHG